MIIKDINDRMMMTERFLNKVINKDQQVLDLGEETLMSIYLKKKGFLIRDTQEEVDFDLNSNFLHEYSDIDVLTAFEVLEHLFAPINILSNIPCEKLILTIPLKLWFASAYMHEAVLDGGHVAYGHYHEFEPEQLHMLLDRTGWKIMYSEKWKAAPKLPLGIRPILRYFYPRYYAVYCERVKPYETGNYKFSK